jgi:hypothetical protein
MKKSKAPDGPSMQIFSEEFLASIEDAQESEAPGDAQS